MASAPKKKSNGVTVVVVVIVMAALFVPCVGVLAAIAIPAFIGYLARSKTAEASSQLSALYQGAAAYYAQEHYVGRDGSVVTGCVVSSERTSNSPGRHKTVLAFPPGSSFEALGFAPPDPLYYQYEIVSVGGCGHPANTNLYSFRAHGDLDGDGRPSLFELAAGSGPSNELVRAAGVYTENELE